eukprot:TRINITY_DN70781_c0_g1_i1.p1 TRINITY_DN70781_c0_g1~~TRINITY_DN70781_c0_g1_i1.p1  ORF type:complete len:333 (-),score=43.71 TRINITY_DN70781_c0_g1_i1:69-1067(-)
MNVPHKEKIQHAISSLQQLLDFLSQYSTDLAAMPAVNTTGTQTSVPSESPSHTPRSPPNNVTTAYSPRKPTTATNSTQTANPCEAGNVITLNVGGTVLKTTLSTLSAEPDTFFSTMVSSGWRDSSIDTEGAFFIDRDARFVGELLNYLRAGHIDGNLGVPLHELSAHDRWLLWEQVDYFQIHSLLRNPEIAALGPRSPKTEKQQFSNRVQYFKFVQCRFDVTKQTDMEQDILINQVARSAGGVRAATLREYRDGLIDNLPLRNVYGLTVFTGPGGEGSPTYHKTTKSHHTRTAVRTGAMLDGSQPTMDCVGLFGNCYCVAVRPCDDLDMEYT